MYQLCAAKLKSYTWITPAQFEFFLGNDCRISVGFDGIWD